MPFKSEAQRKYLWANEPEIARDWTDTYGSRIQKNTGGISQLVKSSGDGKRPGYSGKDAATRSFAESAYAGDTAGFASASKHGFHGEKGISKDERDRRDYESIANVIDKGRKADLRRENIKAQEKKKIEPTKTNIWNTGINKINKWSNAKNLEWAKKNKAKKNQALKAYLQSIYTTQPHMDVDEIMEGLAGSWDQSTGTFGTYDFKDGFHKDTTFDVSNWGGPQLGPFGLSTKGKTGKELGTNYLDQTGDFSTKTPATLQMLGFGKPNFNTLKSHFNRTSMLDDLIAKGDDLKQTDIDTYLDTTNPNRHGGGGDNNYMGYPSYQAWLAAQQQVGGGSVGPVPEEDTDWRTTQWNFDTVYPYPNYKDGGRIPAAFGGIMDTKTGRKRYIFGSIKKAVKGVAKAAGKVLKSDFGKAALGIGAFMYGPKLFNADKLGWGGWGQVIPKTGFMSKVFRENIAKKGMPFEAGGLDPWKMLGIGMTALPFLGIGTEAKQDQLTDQANRGGHLIDPITNKEALPKEMRATLNAAIEEAGNDPIKLAAIEDAYPYLNLGQFYPYQTYGVKDGGRIGAQEGGLMNLGGMEKDYRNEGGFVALGGEERADDVPARLSKNEFVFTADAVRGAGGGDIDKGAEIMENVMKNLDQGGKVSEETQGNAGAQQMFSVSERIGEVL